ncbi:glycosyltransferase family 2 protein [Pseudomonas moorei]|uniref:Glycosyltransferase involved in cell wall bisynthesis n=1 Tax=Pseudomonas moorei TaxID=395599 RepID=A0A1H1CD98_9PSED|nr:glycosyltransferase family A protein [Pseudomonas moorei]KAB0504869.1 glycosyltransferase family 2 protein [Pseudomonas moorei]SDQ62049.1 Glycosyltransferase involved in cell wall bisynthesis [Pseudomonas moorei]
MKFDIVIPFKDAETHLPNICADLENQTNKNFTAHFVSDQSSDESLAYLKNDFSFSYHVWESDGIGPGAARNTGINSSSGDYILFIDADDRITKDYTSKFYEKARSTGADIIECMYQSIDSNGTIVSGTNLESFISSSDRFLALVYGDVPRLSWGKAYKRKAIEDRHAFFPENIHNGEDHIFLLKAYKDLPHIEIICEHLYRWIRHPQSLTNRETTEKTIEDFVRVSELKAEILNLTSENRPSDEELLLKFSRRIFKEARILISKVISDSKNPQNIIRHLRELMLQSTHLNLTKEIIKNDSTSYWKDVME